jgi:predicted MFS family arabinose efflux permease
MSGGAIPVGRSRLLSSGFTALLVANVCFGYAFSSFLLLPKYLEVQLGAGPADVGALIAAHGVTIVVLLPLLGAAVDRSGRRGFLVAGALLMAAASAGYRGVGEVGALLYALRVAQALAFAMVFAAGGALAVDLAPPERLGQAIGFYGLSFLSMNALAPAVVERLASHAGWPTAFASAVVGALLCAALALRLPRGAPEEGRNGNGASLLQVARRPGQPSALLVIALVGSALASVFAFYQLFALELGIRRVSGFFVAYSLAAIVMRAGFGHLIDQWGHRRVSTGVLVLYVATVLGVSRLDVFGLGLLGACLGVAHGVFYPSFNAAVVAGVGAGERGKVMSLFQAAFQVGMAGGGLGFGLLAEAAGYPAVFRTAAAGLVVALGVLLASGRRARAASG